MLRVYALEASLGETLCAKGEELREFAASTASASGGAGGCKPLWFLHVIRAGPAFLRKMMKD